ncbi:DUF1634 domain-containing protein [Streptococcus oricebi]|uniref:DUF1634 domain-containing protein n=1 Tax=Streptococcus oricebi TaxID=1547447 RepID=A0ABS5B2K0_9STRE|nr:DUF1634 domain-containing protein [Streptococcus oricebi]MBP2623032.1 DUF1634 domain-containing protein [Streptococcus oricebi]
MTDKFLEEEKDQLELVMGKILRNGIILSLVLMLVGLSIFFLGNQAPLKLEDLDAFNPLLYLTSHGLFDGLSLMLLGLFILILTPIFRVLSTFFIFFKTKDQTYMGFTALVLLIILISIVLAFIVEPK